VNNGVEIPKVVEPLGLNPPIKGGLDPPERNWDGVGIEPEATLYPGGVKTPEALDGTWVGMGIEAFKALYPRGSDGICLDERGVPIGGWLATVFPVGIIVVFGTIVEWAC
jgi:hypothetical protein